MPKQTFFNLPAQKREQILDVAIDEFADNDYENASISRIVARAGIAKGSFYQYFADKEDLLLHLLALAGQKKAEYLSLDRPDPLHIGVFAYLRWAIEVGVAFELANPRLVRLGLRAINSGALPPAVVTQNREMALAFYRRLVEVGVRQGDIDAGLDPELAAIMFETILTDVGRLIVSKTVKDGFAAGEDGLGLLERPEVRALLADTVMILEHGMGRREPAGGA